MGMKFLYRRLKSNIADLQAAFLYFSYKHLLKNPLSRSRFLADVPNLTEVQKRIVGDLNARGVAFAHFQELFSDRAYWERLSQDAADFSSQVMNQGGVVEKKKDTPKDYKEFLIKKYSWNAQFSKENLWLRLGLDPRILAIVNSYLQLYAKLNMVDLWHTLPQPDTAMREYSQNWHRDPDDDKMLKIFLYFSDVSERNGAMEYVPDSSSSGPYFDFQRLPVGFRSNYFPSVDLEKCLKNMDKVSCFGPPGTMVFCDTRGFHRGGFSTEESRLLANFVYVTPASLSPRRFLLDGDPSQWDISAVAKRALG